MVLLTLSCHWSSLLILGLTLDSVMKLDSASYLIQSDYWPWCLDCSWTLLFKSHFSCWSTVYLKFCEWNLNCLIILLCWLLPLVIGSTVKHILNRTSSLLYNMCSFQTPIMQRHSVSWLYKVANIVPILGRALLMLLLCVGTVYTFREEWVSDTTII